MDHRRQVLCDPYFWESPKVLVGSAWWRRWSRASSGACASEITNEIAAVYLFSLIVGSIIAVVLDYMWALPIALLAATLFLIPAFVALRNACGWIGAAATMTEGFQQGDFSDDALTPPPAETFGRPLVTDPTAENPFMNVSIPDIKYDPKRPAAANISAPKVSDALDAFFRVQWTSDPTDVFGRTQSQRQFVAMPSTSIPNDQESYQNWLYRIAGKTCKEGGREACLPGTDGAVVPWLSTNA